MRYGVFLALLSGLCVIVTLDMVPAIDWYNDRPLSPGFPAPAWLLEQPHCYSLQFVPKDWFTPNRAWPDREPPTVIQLLPEPGMMFRHPVGPLLYRADRRPTRADDAGWWRYVQQDSVDVILTSQHDSYFGFLLRMSIRSATWHGRAWTRIEDAGHAAVTAIPVRCPATR